MHRKPTISDVIASAKEAPKRLVKSGDPHKDNPDVEYLDISDKDWSDKRQVTANTIVQAFQNAYKSQDRDTIEKIVQDILILTDQRIHEIDNAFGKANFELFDKKLWKIHSETIFDTPELNEYLGDGDLQLFVTRKYFDIYYEAIDRALPLDDTNASRQQESFANAKNIMIDLLLRTNQKKNAQLINQMFLDEQPDTLESFLVKQMKKFKDELTASNLEENKPEKIAIALKKEIKVKYEKRFKEFKTMMIETHKKNPKKRFNVTSLNRKVHLLMKFDLQIELLPLKNKKQSSGLGLSDEAVNYYQKK